MESLLAIAIIALLLVEGFYLFTWPIRMGKNKGLPHSEMLPIRILTWCGLLAGFTWFIGLFLAITAKRRRSIQTRKAPQRSYGALNDERPS